MSKPDQALAHNDVISISGPQAVLECMYKEKHNHIIPEKTRFYNLLKTTLVLKLTSHQIFRRSWHRDSFPRERET